MTLWKALPCDGTRISSCRWLRNYVCVRRPPRHNPRHGLASHADVLRSSSRVLFFLFSRPVQSPYFRTCARERGWRKTEKIVLFSLLCSLWRFLSEKLQISLISIRGRPPTMNLWLCFDCIGYGTFTKTCHLLRLDIAAVWTKMRSILTFGGLTTDSTCMEDFDENQRLSKIVKRRVCWILEINSVAGISRWQTRSKLPTIST